MSATAPSAEQLRAILEAGIRAPSAENRHALRIAAREGGVTLRATDTAGWHEQPHRVLLAMVALGAVVENMLLRARSFGFVATPQWLPDGDAARCAVRWTWQRTEVPMPEAEARLDAAIEARHTNRRFYRRERVSDETLGAMADAAQAIGGARLQWLDAPELRRTALRAIGLAEGERFRRRELHRELFGAVRFELGWRASSDEGLAPAALEVEAPMRPGFSLMRHWPVMRTLAGLGLHHALGLRAGRWPAASAPHLALLSVHGDGAAAMARGGRAMQRAWLAAAAHGVAVQPMAAAVALSMQRPGGGWVSSEVQQRLHAALAQLVGQDHATPVMLLRLGRARRASAIAQRPAVDRYHEA